MIFWLDHTLTIEWEGAAAKKIQRLPALHERVQGRIIKMLFSRTSSILERIKVHAGHIRHANSSATAGWNEDMARPARRNRVGTADQA